MKVLKLEEEVGPREEEAGEVFDCRGSVFVMRRERGLTAAA